MPDRNGELIKSTSLADVAIKAFRQSQRELAEYEARLNQALGAKPGPKTVGEREIESATAEAIGIGINVNDWTRGSLSTSRSYSWPCLFSNVLQQDNALLIYRNYSALLLC
jgi:hypothetical protein